MQGIFNAILDFFELIIGIVTLPISWFLSLVEMVFTPFLILFKLDTSGTPAVPSFILTFVIASVTIGVIFKILGRRLGK